ncbi:MAG: hypothetical protein AAB666_02065 [Patescibacteria group bacterium]
MKPKFLTNKELDILHRYPVEARRLARHLLAVEGSIFTLSLDYTGGLGLIDRLLERGGPWGYGDVKRIINDDNFPVTGSGIVPVRFRLLRGYDLARHDNQVYFDDLDARFKDERLRRPNAVEALLVPAEDRQIGREHPMLIPIQGASNTWFYVYEDVDVGRCLGANGEDGERSCTFGLEVYFLGVCE